MERDVKPHLVPFGRQIYLPENNNTPTFTWEFLQLALTYPCSLCLWDLAFRGGRQVMHLHHRG